MTQKTQINKKYFKIKCRANINNPLCTTKMNPGEQITIVLSITTKRKSFFLKNRKIHMLTTLPRDGKKTLVMQKGSSY